MPNKFKLNIVTPDGKSLIKNVDIVNVVTTNGTLGILYHHLPLVAVVEISHLNYKIDNESFDVAIGGGILNVKQDETIILAESFETKEEIDLDRARKSKERAESRINGKTTESVDIKRAEISLLRALNRLSL